MAAATRTLETILAADVVGYSRLMSEDEAWTARAVREHREAATPIVASHGGRLVKSMDDGEVLERGRPRGATHSPRALRRVQFAL